MKLLKKKRKSSMKDGVQDLQKMFASNQPVCPQTGFLISLM